ncbi:hypothetical protein [Bradyrhizobium sp. 2TAF24]|uniref:hypothetical protein n=1 Tax=Bradyrhizobium sp. 2TAF24 TaxID=3233011 RepID=UPI003F91A151
MNGTISQRRIEVARARQVLPGVLGKIAERNKGAARHRRLDERQGEEVEGRHGRQASLHPPPRLHGERHAKADIFAIAMRARGDRSGLNVAMSFSIDICDMASIASRWPSRLSSTKRQRP